VLDGEIIIAQKGRYQAMCSPPSSAPAILVHCHVNQHVGPLCPGTPTLPTCYDAPRAALLRLTQLAFII